MKIELGNYELDCDIDPRIQNNASDETIVIDDVGFIFNCVFKQKRAFEYSVESIKKVYPNSKVYAVSDGGLDYSYMEDDNVKCSLEEDTVSHLKEINGDNFLKPNYQIAIRNGMKATIRRVVAGIEYCGNPEWICMLDPDVLVRGKINHPKNGKVLGTRLNSAWMTEQCLDKFMGLNGVLAEVEGSIPVLRWGAAPVVFHTETFLKALKVYEENFDILNKLPEKHYAPGTFDLFICLIFALVGEPEVYNADITECLRNPSWQTSGHPIVHQFREYYESNDHYGS
jgi:hypothetical protein